MVLVAAALLLAGLALVDPTAAQSEPATTTTAPGTAARTTVPPNMPPPPLDVLLVGDSIMKSTGPALAHQLGSRYRVHNEGVNGSGLLTPDVFDWPRNSRNRWTGSILTSWSCSSSATTRVTRPRCGWPPTGERFPTFTRRPSPGSGDNRPSGT